MSSSPPPVRPSTSWTPPSAIPDAGTGSARSKALDAAVGSGDVATANRLADESISRLEAGRRQLAIAGGWEPGRAMAIATDRFFLASEVLGNGQSGCR
jgi:hypothetical protein